MKIPIKKHFKMFKEYVIFVFFIIICNILFSNIIFSLKVGIKLFLAIDMTYIMGNYFDNDKITAQVTFSSSEVLADEVNYYVITKAIEIVKENDKWLINDFDYSDNKE